MERIWLDVPFSEKDEAKRAGARWDRAARRWYAPHPDMPGLSRWAAAPDVPELLPGEDRTLGDGLFVDLVPSTCWFTNVRSCVTERDWERLRRMVVGRAGQRCEVCQAAADRRQGRWLEVHERWTYDDRTRVQRLGRLICLCTPCHTVTHFGLAQLRGREAEAKRHLMAVTGMGPAQAQEHIDQAFEVWYARSQYVWELDLGILTGAGVTVVPPPDAVRRAEEARAELAARRGS